MRFPLIIFSIILLSCSLPAQAKMYKWIDDEGQMHFGDKIPLKYQVKEHDELNERGMKVKTRAAAKTQEEKAEDRRLKKEQEKAAKLAKKKKQRDRVLLDTYTTETDLIVARDSRLEAVESQVRLAEAIIDSSNKKIGNMEAQVASIKESNREVPESLYQRIESDKQQVAVQSKVRDRHKKRYDEIDAQFSDYIERFKVLKAEKKALREKRRKEGGY
ncbi:MAG: DUF4124 domain-containing protein [Proteobacteria bacterium]|nr:DUF4124 domain-containing protein [Pseudomonadota bacterium]